MVPEVRILFRASFGISGVVVADNFRDCERIYSSGCACDLLLSREMGTVGKSNET